MLFGCKCIIKCICVTFKFTKSLGFNFSKTVITITGLSDAILNYIILPETKNFDCVGRGDLTSLFFPKVAGLFRAAFPMYLELVSPICSPAY